MYHTHARMVHDRDAHVKSAIL